MILQTFDNKSTKEMIRFACFQMMKEKPIDKIHIKDITDYVNVSRGAFYIYYESLYSLIDEVCEEIMDNIAVQQCHFLEYNITENDFFQPHPILLSTFSYIKETVHEHQALWGSYKYERFVELARAHIKATIFQKLIYDGKIDSNINYFERFIIDGFISLHTQWIFEGCTKSPSEMVLLATKLCYKPFYS